MATKVFKENLIGKYDGVSPTTLLKTGSVSDGKNMRKVGLSGGWKVRKGVTLHNTTQISAHSVKSLHRFKHPRNLDYHFIAQINSLLYNSTNDPPASGTTFGTSLGVAVGTTPGFSAVVSEKLVYADGSGIPIIWGGDTPLPHGFLVYDVSETAYMDYSRAVKDKQTTTKAIILAAAGDKVYLLTAERCEGFIVDLGSAVNSNAVTLTVKAWRSGSWTSVSNLADGTDSPAGTTLAQDGTVAWDRSTSDDMKIISGIMGYAYEIGWSGALSESVDLLGLTTIEDADHITNKWNGAYEWIAGARFYDQSADKYIECLGKVSNESTSQYLDISSATTLDFLYIKTIEPATAFGFGIPADYGNVDAAAIDQLDYWNGDSWVAVTTNLSDTTKDGGGTKSFSQTGVLSFDASNFSPQKRMLEGDSAAGYWYRISWAAALSTNVRIYLMAYAVYPEALPTYDGCVAFKNRNFLWGDPEFPNRLRYSATRFPDCFVGGDSGYTEAFGDMTQITCAVPFYNELIVFKENSFGLLEGFNPQTFGMLKIADTIGLASPETTFVVEIGYAGITEKELLTIAIWQAVDGVYVFDGRKPKKVSLPIDNYFNPESSDCIPAANIKSLSAFVDEANNEYHLLLPTVELVYNYITDEWYPPWVRSVALTSALSFEGTDNRTYTYGGSATGYVFRLENDTSDKNVSNADIAIDHSVTSRAITVDGKEGVSLRFTLRKLWAELKARASGSIVTTVYKNLATSGVVANSPEAMTMINAGYEISTPVLDLSTQDCSCFKVKFSSNVIDQEMEIRGFLFELEARGFLDK